MLSEKEQSVILHIARNAIESLFQANGQHEERDPILAEYPFLNEQRGVFVTLRKDGELRGCIGYIISEEPLYDAIRETAKMAASQDSRFRQVKEEELEALSIEVSILSLPENITSYDEIVVGKHGLIVTEFSGSGVLLPQVAIERQYTKAEFLSALCKKAGLPSDLWEKRMLKLKVFTAEVFKEMERSV